ncbi:hypothetical protein PR048_013734 [Dryococelus australis]|uniref:TIAM1 CC-Ex domain-containing protein n=1 Tax=Dryococelus australis TaxID=614101 RepID=A0ABQ9HT10_9NEOP|nr:hypothetical protein PR048_013734 [Dryococelus australis]
MDIIIIFCVFQAPCQVELENWVNSIHSACAAAFARHRGKTGTLHLLQEEIFRLEKAIESVSLDSQHSVAPLSRPSVRLSYSRPSVHPAVVRPSAVFVRQSTRWRIISPSCRTAEEANFRQVVVSPRSASTPGEAELSVTAMWMTCLSSCVVTTFIVDYKLKHMADLQQSVVSDPETKQEITNQIIQWEENLERLHCEQFRLRCYMASLQSGELPNPKIASGFSRGAPISPALTFPVPLNPSVSFYVTIKDDVHLQSLLTHVSRATKGTLNRLGVFTVSSFHAFICARSPSLLNNLLAGRGATKRRTPMLSRSNSGSSRRSLQMSSRDDTDKPVKVALPDSQVTPDPPDNEVLCARLARRWPFMSVMHILCQIPIALP